MQILAMTNVNWMALIEQSQASLGYSPTRGLDEHNLSIKDASSYLACLALDNDPLNNLRFGNHNNSTHEHVHVSMIDELDDFQIMTIMNYTNLKLLIRDSRNRNKYLVILTGNIREWKHACVAMCQEEMSSENRFLFNDVVRILKKAKFQDIFIDTITNELLDGSFILRKK